MSEVAFSTSCYSPLMQRMPKPALQVAGDQPFPFSNVCEAVSYVESNIVRDVEDELSCLPSSVREIVAYLQMQDREGKIIWEDTQTTQYLQSKIDTARKGNRPLSVLVGTKHGVISQQQYLNALFNPQKGLTGIDYYAYELLTDPPFVGTETVPSMTRMILDYVQSGSVQSLVGLKSFMRARLTMPEIGACRNAADFSIMGYQDNYIDSLIANFLAFKGQLQQLVSLDLSDLDNANLSSIINQNEGSFSFQLYNSIRDVYMARSLESAGVDGGVRVAFVGGLHARYSGLPRFIEKSNDVLSIQVSGGVFDSNKNFDVAVKTLASQDPKWGEGFSVQLEPENVLGDLIIQLPFSEQNVCVYQPLTVGISTAIMECR